MGNSQGQSETSRSNVVSELICHVKELKLYCEVKVFSVLIVFYILVEI